MRVRIPADARPLPERRPWGTSDLQLGRWNQISGYLQEPVSLSLFDMLVAERLHVALTGPDLQSKDVFSSTCVIASAVCRGTFPARTEENAILVRQPVPTGSFFAVFNHSQTFI